MNIVRRLAVCLLVCCVLISGFLFIDSALAASSTLTISNPDAWSVWSWDDSITARWNSVTGASGYYIALRNKTTDTLVVEKTYTENTSFKISSYMPEESATYHIWVGAVASESADTYLSQDQLDFYVAHEPDITNGSAESITSTGAVLSMDINLNYGFDITDWGFYVGTSSSVSSMEQYSYGATTKGTKTAQITGLSPNTTYYYRAYAENEAGEEYTSAKSFKTLVGNLSKPVITNPSDSGTCSAGTDIKLQWNAVSGADGYRYYIKQLSGAPDRNNQDEAYINKWEGSVSSSRLYYTLGGTNVKGGYWYKFVVEAYASGVSSSWSSWVYTYVEPGQLAKAKVVSPSNTATYSGNQAILFDWDAVTGAEGYHWYIKRLSGMPDRTNTNEPALKSWDGTTNASTTKYTLAAGNAIPGYWYKFVVEAHADGMTSSWSEWVYCYLDEAHLEKPVISSPQNWDDDFTEGSGISVKWGSVSSATGYRIHIKKLSGYPDTSNANEPSVKTWRIDRGTNLSYTLSSGNVEAGYWYKFVVEAYNASSSSWSNYVYIYVGEQSSLSRPVITSPAAKEDLMAGDDIRLAWTKVNNATGYRYYVKQLSGEPNYSDNEKAAKTWSGMTGAVGRQFVLAGANVQPNTWYKFVVEAEADGYKSSWSKYVYIRIPDREDWIHYVLPQAITTIETEAFSGNKLLRTFDAGKSSLLTIESKAFSNCTNLQSINLPESVRFIADDAFSNCPNLTIHCISGSYAEQFAASKGIAVEAHGVTVEENNVHISATEWVIPTIDAAQTAITVNSTASWSAAASASWITLSKTSGTNGNSVIVSASKNTGSASRTGKVAFTCGNAKAELKVIQNASASNECSMQLSRIYWEPSASELSREIIVQGVSGYTVSSDASWLTYTKSNATVTAKVTSASLSSAKTGKLTIKCSDCGASQTVTVSIKQTTVPVPTGLKIEAIDPQTLKVSWNPVSGATYLIQRSKNGTSGWTDAKTTAAGVCSFSDEGLESGTTYYYRVYARKTVSGSAVSSSASTVSAGRTGTTEQLSFTGSFGSLSEGGMDTKANLGTLSWAKTASAKSYKISMCKASGTRVIGEEGKPADVGNIDSYSISSYLQEGVSYRVWVGGYNSNDHLVAQTDALTFTVQSASAEGVTLNVIQQSPLPVVNSGESSFAIPFTAKKAHSFKFEFKGFKVQEKWDHDDNRHTKQGYKSTWLFDGAGDFGKIDKGWGYSYDNTNYIVRFYPEANITPGDYTVVVTAIGYESSKSVSYKITINKAGSNANDVIATAKNEIGYKEKKSNNQLNSKEANSGSGNYTKYAQFFDDLRKYKIEFYNGSKNGYEWCDMFVDWCFVQTFGYEEALKLLCQPEKSAGAGTGYSYNYFKNTGTTPKIGAQIFFGNGKTWSSIYHTGLVYDFDDNKVYTIEGNSDNSVAYCEYSRTNSSIFGYGYPSY